MREGNEIIGVAGVQQIGKFTGLLRSLAVREDSRGRGIGAKLYRAAEEHACSMGFRELFALTSTVEEWLARLGYERLRRDEAPETLRATAQFSALCPAERTTIMRKTLRVASKERVGVYECAE